MNITMTAITKRQRTRFLYTKEAKKNCEMFFMYKTPDTFEKSKQFPLRFNIQKAIHLTLPDFHEIFEVCIYIQNA